MVKIENRQDFELLNSNYLVKKYLLHQYNLICKNYDCTDLKNIGAFFYLHNKDDLNAYKEAGLSLPFDKEIYETSDLLTLNDGKSKITIFQVIYLLNNDMAITVIFDMKSLDELTKSWFLEDFTERMIVI